MRVDYRGGREVEPPCPPLVPKPPLNRATSRACCRVWFLAAGRAERRMAAHPLASSAGRWLPGHVGELPVAVDRTAVDDAKGLRLALAANAADQLSEPALGLLHARRVAGLADADELEVAAGDRVLVFLAKESPLDQLVDAGRARARRSSCGTVEWPGRTAGRATGVLLPSRAGPWSSTSASPPTWPGSAARWPPAGRPSQSRARSIASLALTAWLHYAFRDDSTGAPADLPARGLRARRRGIDDDGLRQGAADGADRVHDHAVCHGDVGVADRLDRHRRDGDRGGGHGRSERHGGLVYDDAGAHRACRGSDSERQGDREAHRRMAARDSRRSRRSRAGPPARSSSCRLARRRPTTVTLRAEPATLPPGGGSTRDRRARARPGGQLRWPARRSPSRPLPGSCRAASRMTDANGEARTTLTSVARDHRHRDGVGRSRAEVDCRARRRAGGFGAVPTAAPVADNGHVRHRRRAGGGDAADHASKIDFGDGESRTLGVSVDGGTTTVAHVYEDDGTYRRARDASPTRRVDTQTQQTRRSVCHPAPIGVMLSGIARDASQRANS